MRKQWVVYLAIFISSKAMGCEDWIATAIALTGEVRIQNQKTGTVETLLKDRRICTEHVLITGENSRAALYLRNNSYMRIGSDTVITFPSPPSNGSSLLQLERGISHFISRLKNRFNVQTPFVNAGVEGTEFIVTALPDMSSISVIEGTVNAQSPTTGSSIQISSGEQAKVTANQQQLSVIHVEKAEMVDWAIYYPPLFTINDLALDSNIKLQIAQYLEQQRPDLAIKALLPLNQTSTTSIAKAALLLSAGQKEKAENILRPINTPESLALQSVISSASNHNAASLALAKNAVSLDATSVHALIALSIAQQANLELYQAKATAISATQVAPNNSLAWSRLSDLQIATGDLSNAVYSAKKASALDTNNGEVVAQEALANLFSLKLDEANLGFDRALALTPNNPRSYLGRGLTQLRRGNIANGRRDLEIATSLDPTKSVLRSYLGRAYFEEKRDKEASTQWELAKEFDPQDPTPWFYEGVRKLYSNRPISAIKDIEKSLQLNDQRAPYRSESLLQNDEAARASTISDAYTAIGFQQGLKIKAIEAIDTNPFSSQGHRLLAANYRSDKHLESARVSELLQSQLLQPPSNDTSRPQSKDSDILPYALQGPLDLSTNEYNKLFMTDGVNARISGMAGSNNTYSEDLSINLLNGPLSLGISQYKYDSAGSSNYDPQQQDIINLIANWEVTPRFRIQGEIRQTETESGYLGLSEFESHQTTDRDINTYRIGGIFNPSATSLIMTSLIKQHWDETYYDYDQMGGITTDKSPLSAEIKYQRSIDSIQFEAGYGYYKQHENANLNYLSTNVPGLLVEFKLNYPFEQTTFFSSVQFSPTPRLQLEAGVSYDELKHSDIPGSIFLNGLDYLAGTSRIDDINEWSPKLGTSYRFDSVIFRAAFFREVKRDIAANQTIAKTETSGFNQIYDDLNYSLSENYGLGFDTERALSCTFGGNFIKRKIDFNYSTPNYETASIDLSEHRSNESYHELYTNCLPTDTLSLSLSYKYNKVDNLQHALGNSGRSYINLINLTFWPNSFLSLSMNARYTDQEYDYSSQIIADSNESFSKNTISNNGWAFDVSSRLKLPKRMGHIEMGINNLTNSDSELLDDQFEEIRYPRDRFIYANFTLQF